MSGGGGSVPESFDRAASMKRAALVRDQWDDYKTRFQPIEDSLVDKVSGGGLHTTFNNAGLAQAQKGVDTAFTSAVGSQARDLSRFGQSYNKDQLSAFNTNMDLAKTTAGANAVNTASMADIDRKNAVMTTGLGDASTAARG
ncbi:MAG: hypothetical protein ACXWAT_00330 [Methylobacter sp.]